MGKSCYPICCGKLEWVEEELKDHWDCYCVGGVGVRGESENVDGLMGWGGIEGGWGDSGG